MNNIIERIWNQGSMVTIEDLSGAAFQAESGGHTFRIRGVDKDGNALTLSGTPSGVMLRADGQDVTLTCSVSGGVVTATLPANAYSVPGRFGITIFLTSDSQKTALYAAIGSVVKTSSGTVAPPAGSDVVDLINQINTAIAAIPVNYNASFAPAYSTSGLYSVGQYVTYDGNLYRCISTISSGESWTSSHWTQVALANEVCDLKSALINSNESVDFYDYILKYGWVSGHVQQDGTITSSAYKTIGDYVPVNYGDTIIFDRSTGESFTLFLCAYDSSKNPVGDYIGGITVAADYNYAVNNRQAKYIRFSVSATVSTQLIVINKNTLKMYANEIYDELYKTVSVPIEQGNINSSGNDASSTKNIRTFGYIPDNIDYVECDGQYRFCVAKYNKSTGALVGSRSQYLYTFYDTFDHDYAYRVAFNKSDGTDISPSDKSHMRFMTKRKLKEMLFEYDNAGNISIEMEMGNINTSGQNVESSKNIRTVAYIPEYISSIMTKPGYVFCIEKLTKSTGAHYQRSSFNLTEYSDFDYSTYFYRVAMAKANNQDISLSEKNNLLFNTPLLDLVNGSYLAISGIQNKNTEQDTKIQLLEIPHLNEYLNEDGYNIVARSLHGIASDSAYINGGFDIAHETKSSHDATMCIKDDIVYCVRSLYTGSGDNASNDDSAVVLTICGIDGSNMETINVAKKDDTVGGITIAGGCGSPNLFLDGNDIHIYFTAHISGDYTIFHCIYDILSEQLTDYEPITINGEVCSVSVINELLGLSYSSGAFNGMQMNASIANANGIVYAGFCAGTNSSTGRGMIIESENFTDWDVFTKLNPDEITPIYEIACSVASGNLYIMARAVVDDLMGYLAKYRISDKVQLEKYYLQNGSTRPDFVKKNGTILLFNTGNVGRTDHGIISIDGGKMSRSTMYSQSSIAKYDYFKGFEYNGKIYGSSTLKNYNNNLYYIHINEYDINAVSDATILNALNGLIN